jgi:hypothetical protein
LEFFNFIDYLCGKTIYIIYVKSNERRKYIDIVRNFIINENLESYQKGKSGFYGYKIGKNVDYPNEILKNISYVEGYLDLSYSKITELPENLEVDGYLSLANTKISKLPNGLIVRGDLILTNCKKIDSLPKDLMVKGNLVLNDKNLDKKELIKKLPNVSNIIIMN